MWRSYCVYIYVNKSIERAQQINELNWFRLDLETIILYFQELPIGRAYDNFIW